MRETLKAIWERSLQYLKPEWAGRLDYWLGWRLITLREPMNGQEGRRRIVREIVGDCGIKKIVETGTQRGTTTEWLAQFGLPVLTCEIDPRYAAFSKERLTSRTNVTVYNGNSVDLLERLAKQGADLSLPTLFYLDAHGKAYLPLDREIALITTSFANPVILIGDFQVPGDPGYAFGDHGPGERLDVDYLLATKVPLSIYFPFMPSSQETGGRRGSATVTSSPGMTQVLDHIGSLRRWLPGS